MKFFFSPVIGLILLAILPAQQAPAPLVLEKVISMAKVEGRIDHMAADVAGHRLFVAALGNNTVEVLDLESGKTLRSLSGFGEPQGIAYAADLDRVFIANGKDGNLRILDGRTFQAIGTVAGMPDADNVRYDEKARLIYVGYGEGALGIVDARSGAKVADVPLAGHPESFRLGGSGPKIFVNVPTADHVAVIDRDKRKVLSTWPNRGVKANFPMILDETNHRIFVGTRKPAKLLVSDFESGSVVSSLDICSDTDDLFFDLQNRLLYIACGQGVIDIIRQDSADAYAKVGSVPTASGARTALFVPELKILCLAVPHRGAQSAEIRVYKTR